jgi:hypothetical protein
LLYLHTWIQNTSTIFALLHPVCLPSPPSLVLRTCFTFLAFIFPLKMNHLTVQVGCLGISDMYILCLN